MSVSSIPLGDVAEIDRSGVAPEQIQSGTIYVGLENITEDGSFVSVKPVSNGDLASTKFRFTGKHILYGKLRPYLRKIARPDFEGVCSTDILPILPGSRVDRDYLNHFLRLDSSISFAVTRSVGVNLPRISPLVLSTLPIPLPPLEEQRRIAAILDKAEALRAKRRQALAKLDSLTQSLFLEMFGDPARNPRNWKVHALGELIADGPQNGLYKPATDYGSGTPILRIDAFYDGEVTDFSELKRVRLSEKEIDSYLLHEDDIVVNRVNSREYLGKSALVTGLLERTVFESNMMRFRVDHKRISPQFLIAVLQTRYIKSQILQRCKDAVNQSSINQDDVKSFELFVPPVDVQQKFVKTATAVKRHFRLMRVSENRVNELSASLQSRAFRGEL